MAQNNEVDSVSDPKHPFGLPMGSVRGFMSLLICGFFWLVLLWPSDQVARPLLGHFVMLFLVLLAFATSPRAAEKGESNFIPWLMRALFIGGSALVVAYSLIRNPELISSRLTPDVNELRTWWTTFMAVLFVGFLSGVLIRNLLGRTNVIFLTLRSWLSVVGLVMLVLEFALLMAFTSMDNKPDDFLRYWQVIEVAIVSAYFGTRV